MKTILLLALGAALSFRAAAQQHYKYPRAAAVVETYRDARGKVHSRRRMTAVPEHHTVTRWHQHTRYRPAAAPGKASR